MPTRKPARRYHDHRGEAGRFAPRPPTAAVPFNAINPIKMGVEQQGWLAGATPGWWISDHLEELRHFVSWIYVGVHKMAQQCAQAKVCVYDAGQQAEYEESAKHYGPRVLAMAKRMRRYRTKANLPDVVAEQREPLPDHPAAALLDNPNPYTSGRQFRYQFWCQKALTGGAYIWEVPNQYGEPEHLWVIPRGWCRPMAPTGALPGGGYWVTPVFNTFTASIVSPSQTSWLIPAEQMIAVGWPNPLYPGEFTSPLAACSRIIDIMEQTDTATWSSFINAVKPSLVFNIDPKGPGGITVAQMDRFMAELEAFKAGAHNHGKILAMLGLTVQQLMAGPSELDYVAGRKQLQEQVLSTQGVPPVMVGQPVGNYSEAAVQAKAAVEFSLEPGLALLADKLTHRWRPIWGDDFAIEITGKSMDDPTLVLQKADKILAVHAAGAASDNELRASVDLPPLDDPVADIPKCLLDPLMAEDGANDPYSGFGESDGVDTADEPASDTSTGIKNPLMQVAGGRNTFHLNGKRFELNGTNGVH